MLYYIAYTTTYIKSIMKTNRNKTSTSVSIYILLSVFLKVGNVCLGFHEDFMFVQKGQVVVFSPSQKTV